MRIHRLLLLALMAATVPATAMAQDPVKLYPTNYQVLLENDKVRVLRFLLRKGDTEQMHHHPPAVTYVLTPFQIRFTLGDGRQVVREAKAGDVFYGEDILHSPLNIGETDASGILVEMKQPMYAPAGPQGHDPEWLTAITFIKGIAGKEDELKQELLALAAPTRAERDCIAYDLYQSETIPNEFVRFEVWRNPAALESHKQTPHIRGSFAKRQQQGWTTNITLHRRVPEP